MLEADGSPVAGVAVALIEVSPEWLRGGLPEVLGSSAGTSVAGRAETDRAGVFRLKGARPDGAHALSIDPGGSRAALRALDTALLAGEEADLGDLVLAPRGVVRGRAVDEGGAPVAGARVRMLQVPAYFGAPDLAGLEGLRKDGGVLLSDNGDDDESAVLEPPAWLWGADRAPARARGDHGRRRRLRAPSRRGREPAPGGPRGA